ncbi:MAG: hypothetical protein NUW37_09450 [Planctomycetes bacterium]|nr:hypothetical protein [Planctomycetota bacterium]
MKDQRRKQTATIFFKSGFLASGFLALQAMFAVSCGVDSSEGRVGSSGNVQPGNSGRADIEIAVNEPDPFAEEAPDDFEPDFWDTWADRSPWDIPHHPNAIPLPFEVQYPGIDRDLYKHAPGVYVDPGKRKVVLEAYVATPRGTIEFIGCVPPGGKLYESVFRLTCLPSQLSEAMELAGFVPPPIERGGLRYFRDPNPPIGQLVDIDVEFSVDGNLVRRSVHDLIYDSVTGRTMADVGFVYTAGFSWPIRPDYKDRHVCDNLIPTLKEDLRAAPGRSPSEIPESSIKNRDCATYPPAAMTEMSEASYVARGFIEARGTVANEFEDDRKFTAPEIARNALVSAETRTRAAEISSAPEDRACDLGWTVAAEMSAALIRKGPLFPYGPNRIIVPRRFERRPACEVNGVEFRRVSQETFAENIFKTLRRVNPASLLRGGTARTNACDGFIFPMTIRQSEEREVRSTGEFKDRVPNATPADLPRAAPSLAGPLASWLRLSSVEDRELSSNVSRKFTDQFRFFVADRQGDVIASEHDPACVFNNPQPEPQSYLRYAANSTLIPQARDVPVKIVITERSKDRPNMSGLEIDIDAGRTIEGTRYRLNSWDDIKPEAPLRADGPPPPDSESTPRYEEEEEEQ